MSENTSSFVGREFKILTTTSHRHSGETFTCLDYAHGVIGYKDKDGAPWSVRNHEVSWVPQVIPPEKPYAKGDYVVLYDWSVWKVIALTPDATAGFVQNSSMGKMWVNVKEIKGKAEDIFPVGKRVEWWPEGNQEQAVVAQITVVWYESDQASLSVLGEGKVVQIKNLRPIEPDQPSITPDATETAQPEPEPEPKGVWIVWVRFGDSTKFHSVYETEEAARKTASGEFDRKATFVEFRG